VIEVRLAHWFSREECAASAKGGAAAKLCKTRGIVRARELAGRA
jgi:hypothetical protein